MHLAADEFFAWLKRHCLHSACLVIITTWILLLKLFICQTDMHHCLADEIHGVKKPLTLAEDDFDAGKFLRQLSSHVRSILIVSPNDPLAIAHAHPKHTHTQMVVYLGGSERFILLQGKLSNIWNRYLAEHSLFVLFVFLADEVVTLAYV